MVGESREELNKKLETLRQALEVYNFLSLKLKVDFYRLTVKSTMLYYRKECWLLKRQHENKISAAEIRTTC
ncbi:hypothetical protein MTR_3g031820 [Medicago truncatula]|uniref:Uncharacterized protein n=1 Tax=Medicago truncatula TaxID=3880 RepID=G7IWX6_MEDTR|nr:hypothetical protein MTR_3g031820 [Medicago truncatula]